MGIVAGCESQVTVVSPLEIHAGMAKCYLSFVRAELSSDSGYGIETSECVQLRLVCFSALVFLGIFVLQHRGNELAHSSCGLVCNTGLGFDLFGGNLELRGGHQIDHVKPGLQWSPGFVKDGACGWMHMMPAQIARVRLTAGDAVVSG